MKRAFAFVLVLGCSSHSAPPVAPPVVAPVDPVAVALGAIREEDMLADLGWLTGPELKGRGSLSQEAKATADRLEKELGGLGFEVTSREIPGTGGQDNVIAVLPGAGERAGETVIVCAHYDHLGEIGAEIFWGADDNASGVTVILAIARAAAAVRGAQPDGPRRTLVVLATGAEESGLQGAEAYVNAPLRPLSTTRAVLNFDMVGRKLLEMALGWDNAFATVGLEADETLAQAVGGAAKAEQVRMFPVTRNVVTLFGFDRRTDDWWFRDMGVPAVHISTGLHDDYHQPTDTADRVSSAQMLRIARVATRALLTLW
jgi:Zn-dependent M28 family amino/carboxypeptidase